MTIGETVNLSENTLHLLWRGFGAIPNPAIMGRQAEIENTRMSTIARISPCGTHHRGKIRTNPAMPDSSFSDLIDCLRAGDSGAAQRFLDQYGEAVRREVRFVLLDARLRRIVSDSDVCQSVLAQFFFGLWAGKYDFERPADLTRLLKAMIHARVADLARYWTADPRDIRKNLPSSSGDLWQTARDATPSRITVGVELLEEVQRRLSERELTIIGLRQEKKSWAEIAAKMGDQATAEGLRKQYDRALARVASELGIAEDRP